MTRWAADHPDAPWLLGGGWRMDAFPGGVPPAGLLDRLVPDRPVWLESRDGHSGWANAPALALAGVTAATTDPPNGRLERDQRGAPTSVLHEGAMRLVERVVPPPSADELARAGHRPGLPAPPRHQRLAGRVGAAGTARRLPRRRGGQEAHRQGGCRAQVAAGGRPRRARPRPVRPWAGPVGDARVLATFVEGAVVHAMKDRRSRRRSTRHLEGQPSTRA